MTDATSRTERPQHRRLRPSAGGDRPADRRHRRGAQDRLRPEIPSDIYELGLIYRVDIDDDRNVAIDMTLTAPGCPVAGEMPGWVENAVSAVEGVSDVEVNMTFDPPWTPDRMSEEAQVATILVCLNRVKRDNDCFAENGVFALNTLDEGHIRNWPTPFRA
jgi:FeS assembly SUF system protein